MTFSRNHSVVSLNGVGMFSFVTLLLSLYVVSISCMQRIFEFCFCWGELSANTHCFEVSLVWSGEIRSQHLSMLSISCPQVSYHASKGRTYCCSRGGRRERTENVDEDG